MVSKQQQKRRDLHEKMQKLRSLSNPMEVAVETSEKGFRVSVHSKKNHDGLLVSILDVFDNLALDVLDATISCSESFSLEALLGSKNENDDGQPLNRQVIKEALLHALKVWNNE